MQFNAVVLLFSLVGLMNADMLDEIMTKVDAFPEVRHFDTTSEFAASVLDVVKTSIAASCDLWNAFSK